MHLESRNVRVAYRKSEITLSLFSIFIREELSLRDNEEEEEEEEA